MVQPFKYLNKKPKFKDNSSCIWPTHLENPLMRNIHVYIYIYRLGKESLMFKVDFLLYLLHNFFLKLLPDITLLSLFVVDIRYKFYFNLI